MRLRFPSGNSEAVVPGGAAINRPVYRFQRLVWHDAVSTRVLQEHGGVESLIRAQRQLAIRMTAYAGFCRCNAAPPSVRFPHVATLTPLPFGCRATAIGQQEVSQIRTISNDFNDEKCRGWSSQPSD